MQPVVSIIIVSMNKIDVLFPCLDCIKEQTRINYETLIVAYMFSDENLSALKNRYPWVKIIESREMRGFAENNNIALKEATGEYCFIVNDDTLMNEPVIDKLVEDFNHLPENTAAISPRIIFPNGNVQTCGRGPWNGIKYLLHYLHLIDETKPGRWTMKEGLFRTYTLNGACFMAKTSIFKACGWFDQTYTFTPEDIALGMLMNKRGYEVYTDANVTITHIANATASSIEAAIKPTRVRGSLILYSSLSKLDSPQGTKKICIVKYALLGTSVWCYEALRGFKYLFCDCSGKTPKSIQNKIMRDTAANVRSSIFTKRSTKEIFLDYYTAIKKS